MLKMYLFAYASDLL